MMETGPEQLSCNEIGWCAVQNALPFAVNLQPGGGLLQLLPSGSDTGAAGGPVPPNATVTYVWGVPSAAGPGPADFSTVAYTYHSSVDTTAHENAGLIGAVVVAGQVRPKDPSALLTRWTCLDAEQATPGKIGTSTGLVVN